eukprot:gene428-1826_t
MPPRPPIPPTGVQHDHAKGAFRAFIMTNYSSSVEPMMRQFKADLLIAIARSFFVSETEVVDGEVDIVVMAKYFPVGSVSVAVGGGACVIATTGRQLLPVFVQQATALFRQAHGVASCLVINIESLRTAFTCTVPAGYICDGRDSTDSAPSSCSTPTCDLTAGYTSGTTGLPPTCTSQGSAWDFSSGTCAVSGE